MDIKTKEDIEALSFHEPLIHHALRLVILGEISFEQAMISCVFFLLQKNKSLEETLVKAINSKPYNIRFD